MEASQIRVRRNNDVFRVYAERALAATIGDIPQNKSKEHAPCIHKPHLMAHKRAVWVLGLTAAAVVLLALAHLHPRTAFELPVLPSGRLFEPLQVHELFQPDNRHLDHQQCLEAYPLLYDEADRARTWFASRGGITESMVDAAEKNKGHARLAIINNNVSKLALRPSASAHPQNSSTSRALEEASTHGRKLLLRPSIPSWCRVLSRCRT